MNDAGYSGGAVEEPESLEECPHFGCVSVIEGVEFNGRRFMRCIGIILFDKTIDSIENDGMGVTQVVDDHDVLSSFGEFQNRVRSDVSQSTGHQNIFLIVEEGI